MENYSVEIFSIFFMMINLAICIIVPVLIILGTAFWIWTIVDAAQRKFAIENEKLLWILVIVFGQLVGAIVYYVAVMRKGSE